MCKHITHHSSYYYLLLCGRLVCKHITHRIKIIPFKVPPLPSLLPFVVNLSVLSFFISQHCSYVRLYPAKVVSCEILVHTSDFSCTPLIELECYLRSIYLLISMSPPWSSMPYHPCFQFMTHYHARESDTCLLACATKVAAVAASLVFCSQTNQTEPSINR